MAHPAPRAWQPLSFQAPTKSGQELTIQKLEEDTAQLTGQVCTLPYLLTANMRISQDYGYMLGGPTLRTIMYWGLNWSPSIYGNYQHVQTLEVTELSGVRERAEQAEKMPPGSKRQTS